jgi:ribosomal protein L35
MKTNKSFTKRIKVTKNGKLVTRRPGQNHFNARQTGRQRLARKRSNTISMSERLVRRFLPGNAGRAKKIAAAAAAAAVEANVINS